MTARPAIAKQRLAVVSNGKVKIIASTENPEVIDKVLKYLGLGEASQAENRSPPSYPFDHLSQLIGLLPWLHYLLLRKVVKAYFGKSMPKVTTLDAPVPTQSRPLLVRESAPIRGVRVSYGSVENP